MTIKVRITHDQPGYDKAITVHETSVDTATGNPLFKQGYSPSQVVHPGESIERYVWPGQMLVIEEGPKLDVHTSGSE